MIIITVDSPKYFGLQHTRWTISESTLRESRVRTRYFEYPVLPSAAVRIYYIYKELESFSIAYHADTQTSYRDTAYVLTLIVHYQSNHNGYDCALSWAFNIESTWN